MEISAEKIKKSKNFPNLLKELNQIWKAEQEKRKEFYEIIHEDVKAEFIHGEVIFHSPVKGKHWITCTRLAGRLSVFVDDNDLGLVGVEKVMIRCTRNDYEPDIVFFKKEQSEQFTDEQLIFPPPSLAVEILSKSTRKNDYGIKFEDYALHRIEEYWIINPEDESIEQYILKEPEATSYHLHQKLTQTGKLKPFQVEGFEIEIEDIFK